MDISAEALDMATSALRPFSPSAPLESRILIILADVASEEDSGQVWSPRLCIHTRGDKSFVHNHFRYDRKELRKDRESECSVSFGAATTKNIVVSHADLL